MNKKYWKLFCIILILTAIFIIVPNTQASAAEHIHTSALSSSNTSNIITTKSQLIKAVIKHITNLDRNFSINISHKVIGNNNRAFNNFWIELTKYPEYNEIIEYTTITKSTTYNHYNYFTWTVNANYKISKSKARELYSSPKSASRFLRPSSVETFFSLAEPVSISSISQPHSIEARRIFRPFLPIALLF